MNRYRLLVVVVLLVVAILVGALPRVAEVSAQDGCPDAPNPWSVGQMAQLTRSKDLFVSPSSSSDEVARLSRGEIVTIIGNHQCANSGVNRARWQYVQAQSGAVGWILELEQGRSSSLSPYGGSSQNPSQPPSQSAAPSASAGGSCPDDPNVWSIGQTAQLTRGKDLYSSPSSSSNEVGSVSRGEIVTIIGNYQCANSGVNRARWQYVQTQSGVVGWLLEKEQGRSSSLAPYGGSTANPPQQQSQPAASQSSAAPAQEPWPVTDGCTDHPEQIYAGESSPPGGDYLRVNVASLRVRMGPGTNYCMNGYAVQGRYYPVHNVKGSWALITGTYGAGWLHLDYVTLYGSYAQSANTGSDGGDRYTRVLLRSCEADPFTLWYFSEPSNLLMFDLNAPSQATEILSVLVDALSVAVQYSQPMPARVVVRDMQDVNSRQYVSDVTWYDQNGSVTRIETYVSASPISFCPHYITFVQDHGLTG